MSKGLTLIEMLIAMGMLIILLGVTMYMFSVVLFSWVSEEERAGLGVELDRAVNMMAKDVREAKKSDTKTIAWLHPKEIRFAVVNSRQADGTPVPNSFSYYIYYFYNANDRYPNTFTQSVYDLKRCALTGVTGYDPNTGAFTYGSGQIAANQLSPVSSLTVNGNTVAIDLSITKGSETMRARTEAAARNTQ